MPITRKKIFHFDLSKSTYVSDSANKLRELAPPRSPCAGEHLQNRMVRAAARIRDGTPSGHAQVQMYMHVRLSGAVRKAAHAMMKAPKMSSGEAAGARDEEARRTWSSCRTVRASSSMRIAPGTCRCLPAGPMHCCPPACSQPPCPCSAVCEFRFGPFLSAREAQKGGNTTCV